MNYLQGMIDGMNLQRQLDRAKTQLTLGRLIEKLEAMPAGANVAALTLPHSYRGYYSDLAFEREEGLRPATDLLLDCRKAMGQVFGGYKGGDYVMGAMTPVWVSKYGCTGEKLVDILPDGALVTEEDTY